MSNEVTVMQDTQMPAVQQGYGGVLQHQTSIEDTRTLQEIKAKIQLARMFPRRAIYPEINAEIEGNCTRFDFAKSAIYSLPRGGQKVEGLSIKAAEMMAGAYTNIDYGFNVTRSDENESEVVCYAWDMERNTSRRSQVIIKHEMKAHGSIKKITDPNDIRQHVTNYAQRVVRACILAVIPQDLQDKAEEICRRTMEKGDKRSIAEQVTDMLKAFEGVNVTKGMIEAKIMHEIKGDNVSPQELGQLRRIFQSIKDGFVEVDYFFAKDELEKKTSKPKTETKAVENKSAQPEKQALTSQKNKQSVYSQPQQEAANMEQAAPPVQQKAPEVQQEPEPALTAKAMPPAPEGFADDDELFT
jgi:hypothetical protein